MEICKQGENTPTDPCGVFTPACGKPATEVVVWPNGESEPMCERHARISEGKKA